MLVMGMSLIRDESSAVKDADNGSKYGVRGGDNLGGTGRYKAPSACRLAGSRYGLRGGDSLGGAGRIKALSACSFNGRKYGLRGGDNLGGTSRYAVDGNRWAVLMMGMSLIENKGTAEWDREAGRAPTRTLGGSGVVRDPLSRGASRRGDRRAGRRWLAMTGQATG